ncbi:hypothetical protein CC1G_12549 [Coprinopsis cinerea okayama7|uniref:2OGFeDO JBP1/TET oxygenase domain-containing protein n=1 Tax=Coprinopsis cinerea (strain Okayama-7 / 130 / ATCC MYA-4618 / FGSC 9003) TaxID=240176 RepID=A8PH78_COPC7|nr:hypothetical protein CC1G_12549 [Coprinopsis cinerea okayama7\|eukprot:XP_001841351.2 hypothetical protein CC1G_12549 [Coprinopsis cinerea okayama7\
MRAFREPLPPGASLVERLGRHAQARMRQRFSSGAPIPSQPLVPLPLQVECENIADTAYIALQNEETLDWSITDWYSKNRKRSAVADEKSINAMESAFPPSSRVNRLGKPILRQTPCVVKDRNGRILTWYLPNSILPERQKEIEDAIRWHSSSHESSPFLVRDNGNYRDHASLFTQGEDLTFKPGVVTYSSAWPMQGHPDTLAPSANLKNRRQGSLEFIERISESVAVLGAILAVIHPALFEMGLEMLAGLNSGIIPAGDLEHLRTLLKYWSSPFTAFSLINNRRTDLHRDVCSPVYVYDLLYTGGNYVNGRIEIRGIGIRCRYDPGTVVATLASCFPHGVPPVDGERVCIAHFFREQALEHLPFYRPPVLPTHLTLNHFYSHND